MCAILDLKVAYFKQILVEILAAVQSFQVANELRTRHPLADVLNKKQNKNKNVLLFHTRAHTLFLFNTISLLDLVFFSINSVNFYSGFN